MEIKYLVEVQDFLPEISMWLYNQWGVKHDDSNPADWVKELRRRLNKDELPMTFVAVRENKPIGTASLVECDMETKAELTPWLADVYVPPEERAQGIATKLVQRINEEAKNLSYDKYYLFTRQATGFYLKLGWEIIETTTYKDKKVDIMVYNL
ncbi:MAG: GNAT family N-acetyltransferase [Bacillota bacterium]